MSIPPLRDLGEASRAAREWLAVRLVSPFVETAAASLGELARQYSPAQRRTIAAALELFVDRGVGDTSLQMIANAVGVTKAAIYHQFRTKEAIVLAVAEVELVGLEEAVDSALADGVRPEVKRELLSRVIGIAVARRKAVGTLLSDPVLLRYLNEQDLYRRLMSRVRAVLFGHDVTDRSRVRAAVLAAAFGAVANQLLADLDADALERELFEVMLALLPDAVVSPS
jgi:AcrR family transcriptional regulator